MSDPAPTETLDDFLARAWDEHADRPADVAEQLMARAEGLGPDGGAAKALVLADHVWLAHLHSAAGLREFLQRIPPVVRQAEACQAVLGRIHWALALADGEAPPDIPDAWRWRGMQSLLAMWIEAGRVADASTMLATEAPRALLHPERDARAALAATCNNLCVDLRLGRRGDVERDALMMALAQASRDLWASAGTWVNVERADYQLSRCHAVLGQGSAAVACAEAALAAIDAHADDPQADAVERVFAHEAMAWAQRAAGHADAEAEAADRMRACLAEINDPSSMAWCEQALQELQAGR